MQYLRIFSFGEVESKDGRHAAKRAGGEKSERRRKIQGRGGCRKSNRRRKFKGLARPAKEAKTPPRRAGSSIRKRAARIAAPARDGESPRRGLSESGGNHFAAGAVALTAFITSCVMSTSGLEK